MHRTSTSTNPPPHRAPRIVGRAAALAGVVVLGGFAAPAAAQPQPSVGAPVRIDPGGGTFSANETTAAATAGGVVVAGWNDWRRSPSIPQEVISTGFAVSADGGATWTDFLLRPPGPNQSNVEGDPMTAVDPRTGTLFAGAISFSAGSNSGIYVARLEPGSSSFEPAVMAREISGTDKCWMAAGPRPGEPDSTRVYVAYNEGVIWSDDLGDTWTSPLPLGSGIGYLPRVGPAGEVYIAYWDFDDEMRMIRSTDGFASFQDLLITQRLDVWGTQSGSRAAGTFRIPSLGSLAVDPTTGDLSYCWFDTTSIVGGQYDLDLYFTRSIDGGTTWSAPRIIVGASEAFAPSPDQLFPWLEIDTRGGHHVVFLDSRNAVRPDGTEDGLYDAYYAYAVDGDAAFTSQRLSPVTFNSSNDGLDRSAQFMGDYLGMAISSDAVFPVYLDSAAGDPDIFTHRIELPTTGDVTGDGAVDFDDVVALLAEWGACPGPGPCAADLDGSGAIDLADLLTVLALVGG